MLPTFVIGLREGLEAALIVGIVAAFLVQEGRRDAMRWVWAGVALGVLLALGVGIGLRIASENLPQREQEQLETVIALIAVAMVTWMIFWMRKHAAGLSGELRDRTSNALATGSTAALVFMAFLAVMREGLETAVFLVAVFNDAEDTRAAGSGAVLGIAVAVILGYVIYRGGVKIDLARFFKVTGAVLVLVAAGLLSTAVHTAHEAGWWHYLLGEAVDLSFIVEPGTVRYALATGVLGIQPKPTVGEVLVYFLYAVPMMWVVLRPRRSGPRVKPAVVKAGAAAATVLLVMAFAVPAAWAKSTVTVKLTDDGCPKRLETVAGPTQFEVKNVDATKVPVKLVEFSVTPTPASVAAGPVTLVVKNAGGLDHELVVVRTATPLPTDAEGAAVEDGVSPADNLGEIEDLVPKSTTKFALGDLTPGTYELFCNIVEEDGADTLAHYGKGMHTTLTVR